jgi:hypothetical protein
LAALGCILQGKDLPSMPFVCGWSHGGISATWQLTVDSPEDLGAQSRLAGEIISALGGKWTTESTETRSCWKQSHDAVKLTVEVSRAAVCERVVVGTHEETREVPDPDAPKITETVVVEDVEWRCIDPLAEIAATAVAS